MMGLATTWRVAVKALAIVVALPGLVGALHLGFMAIASWFYWPVERHRQRSGSALPAPRFAVVIPAHNEESVIGATLQAICDDMDPSDLLIVVADRCTDATASIARSFGAVVLERYPGEEPGRAAARNAGIRFALEHEWDGILMIDADSVVERGFFPAVRRAFGDRPPALQARSEAALGTKLMDQASIASFAIQGITLPRGRGALGLMVRLRGTGMVVRRDMVERFSFRAPASEDLWFSLDMCLEGFVPRHVDGVRLRSESVGNLADATIQRTRYEAGRMSAAKEFVPRLIRARTAASLEAAWFLVSPPFAVCAGSLALGLAVSLLSPGTISYLISAGLFLLAVALVTGLLQARASLRTWLALAAAPWYVGWKMILQVRALRTVAKGVEEFGATPRNPR